MEEKKNIFREKTISKITSPDDLDKYIKTASPTSIVLFIAVLFFVIGLFVWGFVGELENNSQVGFVCSKTRTALGYKVTSYITETDYTNYVLGKDADTIYENMYLEFNDNKYKIKGFSNALAIDSSSNNFLVISAGISNNELYREVYFYVSDSEAFEGQYTGKIVYSKDSPISYLFKI